MLERAVYFKIDLESTVIFTMRNACRSSECVKRNLSRTGQIDEVLVETEIIGKLRVECGGEPPALAGSNGGAVR